MQAWIFGSLIAEINGYRLKEEAVSRTLVIYITL